MLYEGGPTPNGFYPGDAVFTLNWFAFQQFEVNRDVIEAAVAGTDLDLDDARKLISDVTHVWSCQNRFFDVDTRSSLRMYELRPAGNGLYHLESTGPVPDL